MSKFFYQLTNVNMLTQRACSERISSIYYPIIGVNSLTSLRASPTQSNPKLVSELTVQSNPTKPQVSLRTNSPLHPNQIQAGLRTNSPIKPNVTQIILPNSNHPNPKKISTGDFTQNSEFHRPQPDPRQPSRPQRVCLIDPDQL